MQLRGLSHVESCLLFVGCLKPQLVLVHSIADKISTQFDEQILWKNFGWIDVGIFEVEHSHFLPILGRAMDRDCPEPSAMEDESISFYVVKTRRIKL